MAFHHSSGVIRDDWASDSNSLGRSISSFVLPPAPMAKERGISDVSLIFNKGRSGTRSSAGFAVVEGSSQRVEWKGSASSGSGYVHGNGCLPAGMRSMMRRFAIRRAVDQQRVVYALKLPGTLGGSVCSENIRQAEPEPPHLPADGQHNHCGVCQQNGGHTIKHPSEWHHTVWRAPPRNSQLNSRCRIPNLSLLS